jgi:hypothetical protein
MMITSRVGPAVGARNAAMKVCRVGPAVGTRNTAMKCAAWTVLWARNAAV